MESLLHALNQEIQKVIVATYPVSLKLTENNDMKALHNILTECGKSRDRLIRQWAAANREHHMKLASAVVEYPFRTLYIIELIEWLSGSIEVRNALLREDPKLLDDFLRISVDTSSSSAHYCRACLKLLDSPLPVQMALPASAQNLLWTLFDNAVKTPTVESIESVHRLLDGACNELIGIISATNLEGMVENLTKFMRNASTIEDQLFNLLCLATISKTRCQNSGERFDKFFKNEKASKTVHLVTLQVIFACGHRDDEQRLKYIRLAREIVESIELKTRQEWSYENPAILKKLVQKVSGDGILGNVQLEALAFSSLIATEYEAYPVSLNSAFQDSLVQICRNLGLDRHVIHAISLTLPLFGPGINISSWQSILFALFSVKSEQNQLDLTDETHLVQLIEIFKNCWKIFPASRNAMLKALATPGVIQVVEKSLFPSSKSRVTAVQMLSGYLAQAGFMAIMDGSEVDCSLMARLTGKLVTCIDGNRFSTSNMLLPRGVFKAEQRQIIPMNIKNSGWRGRLAAHLEAEASQREELLARFIGDICHDFEERCTNAELPLRQEQQITRELKHENKDLNAKVNELVQCEKELSNHIEDLELRISQAESRNATALSELEEVNRKYSDLNHVLTRNITDYEKTIEEHRFDFERRKLELETTIACEVEKSDELDAKILVLNEELRTAACRLQDETHCSQRTLAYLQHQILCLTGELDAEKMQAVDQKNSNAILHETETQLRSEIQRLEDELTENCRKIDVMIAHEQVLVDEATKQHLEYEQSIENTVTENQAEHQKLEMCLNEAKQELIQANERYKESYNEQAQKIQELEGKLRKSAHECANRDRQLEDARNMRSKLLSALELGGTFDATFTSQHASDIRRLELDVEQRQYVGEEASKTADVSLSQLNTSSVDSSLEKPNARSEANPKFQRPPFARDMSYDTPGARKFGTVSASSINKRRSYHHRSANRKPTTPKPSAEEGLIHSEQTRASLGAMGYQKGENVDNLGMDDQSDLGHGSLNLGSGASTTEL